MELVMDYITRPGDALRVGANTCILCGARLKTIRTAVDRGGQCHVWNEHQHCPRCSQAAQPSLFDDHNAVLSAGMQSAGLDS